tara:strand:+ start:774 stop:1343 length:570 start_codon:yes stop_codon:yes gene_type:complete
MKLIKLNYIKKYQKNFIKDAEIAHERFIFNYSKEYGAKSSTLFYRYYNITCLTVGSKYYFNLFKKLQKIIRKYAGHNKPLWYQSWLNFHNQDEVLNWHNHPDCSFHGYISIRPQQTETQFENYTIQNEVGNIYIGKAGLMHKVNVLQNYKEPRITIAFDVISEKDYNKIKIKNGNIDINTGYIPIYETI